MNMDDNHFFIMKIDLQWRWEDMCGPDGLQLWDQKIQDVGYCFQRLFILIPTLFLLAILSAYYVGQRINFVVRGTLQERAINFRCFIVLCMAILPVVNVFKFLVNENSNPVAIDYFTCGTECIAWLVHFGYVMALRHRLGVSPRGIISLLVLWSITAVLSVATIRTLILLKQPYGVAVVALILQIIYTITLIPPKGVTSPTFYSSSLVGSQYSQLGDRHPLLHGFLEDDGSLGTAMFGANCFSKLIFYWVKPLFLKGLEKQLKDPDDLFYLPPEMSCSVLSTKIEKALIGNVDRYQGSESNQSQNESRRGMYGAIGNERSHLDVEIVSRPKKHNVSLFRALHSCFYIEFYSIGLLKLIADVAGFAGPLLLNKLVTYIEDPSIDVKFGYYYAGGLLLSSLINAFCDSHFSMWMSIVSIKLRSAIITTIFRKTLSVTSTELNKNFSIGEVTNFMSTDTDRIVNFCPTFHALWSIPLQIAVTFYLLYTQVGIAFLAGVVFTIVLIPINKYVANKIGSLSSGLMKHKDGRVSFMTEIIKSIRTIKLYVWEDYFMNKITSERAKEIKYLKGRKYLDAICVFLWATTPVIVTALTLSTYALLGNHLTAATVFTTIALLNMLIAPLNAFPWVLNGMAESWVSVKRIQRLLDLQDLNEDAFYTNNNLDSNIVLSFKKANFRWAKLLNKPAVENSRVETSKNKEKQTPRYVQIQQTDSSIEGNISRDIVTEIPFNLTNISFDVKRTAFYGIIGKVGSGKSSLLKAILAEMIKTDGEIATTENGIGFAYVSQKPWLQHGTIKENILFGKAYVESKFKSVVDACGLTEDIALLGSNASVGEGGSSLSGGQIARIALARAVYQDKHVYLLDDVLSSVDVNIGAHIYRKCIMGLLKFKTRLLVTHSLQYVSKADQIIVMENGSIKEQGSPRNILSEMDDYFGNTDNSDNDSTNFHLHDERSNAMDNISLKTDVSSNSMLDEETSATGSIDYRVILMYCKSIGYGFTLSIFLSLFLMQLSRNTTDLWLSHWVTTITPSNSTNLTQINNLDVKHEKIFKRDVNVFNDSSAIDKWKYLTDAIIQNITNNKKITPPSNNTDDQVTFYLSVYAGFALLNAFFTLIRAFMFAYGGIQAATTIHDSLLKNVIRGKMKFFDLTPAGRILNRFSSDTYTIDDSLPFILNILMAQIFGLLGSLILTIYGLPWICLLIVPLIPIYHSLQHNYRITSREVKRLTSITLSPIYTHFNDTLEGATVIRAFGRGCQWIQRGEHYVERSQRANFSSAAASQWLGLRLRLIGSAVLAGAAIVAVAQRSINTADAGLVGLAITYALSVTSLLGGVINAFTESEREMIAVERVGEYINQIEPEGKIDDDEHGDEIAPPYGWPNMGIICFEGVVMKYRPHLLPSLNNISFECTPGEKIGVVGRTGAGKSSLFASLFRLSELHRGVITIDTVDISKLSLETLRGRLAIIPQEPFIFNGSIRENLDPFEQYTDIELWNALEKCGAKGIFRHKGGLHISGSGLSRGHLQLLCLTRAILQNAKILCIDEATANIDQETDRIIQETIRCFFVRSTVITIAHRISTILDSDRVLVLGDAKILEFDKPDRLLSNPESYFYQLLYHENCDSE